MARVKKIRIIPTNFKALIQTNHGISELSLELLNEGYEYVLTGRLKSDPLERRFSQYRQLSGGRFLVNLQEVQISESIIQMKSLLKRKILAIYVVPLFLLHQSRTTRRITPK